MYFSFSMMYHCGTVERRAVELLDNVIRKHTRQHYVLIIVWDKLLYVCSIFFVKECVFYIKFNIFMHITDSVVPVVLCLLIEKGLSVVSLLNFM